MNEKKKKKDNDSNREPKAWNFGLNKSSKTVKFFFNKLWALMSLKTHIEQVQNRKVTQKILQCFLPIFSILFNT